MAAEPKTNGNDRFKLPGSSLDEVFKVVQGYASFGKTASLADIVKNTRMHESSISRNVGFLLSIGILQGGRDKSVTEVGKKLGLALLHSVQEDIEAILSDIVAENEFLKNVLAAVESAKEWTSRPNVRTLPIVRVFQRTSRRLARVQLLNC